MRLFGRPFPTPPSASAASAPTPATPTPAASSVRAIVPPESAPVEMTLAAFGRLMGEIRGGIGGGLTEASVECKKAKLAHGAGPDMSGLSIGERLRLTAMSFLPHPRPDGLGARVPRPAVKNRLDAGRFRRDVDTLRMLDAKLARRIEQEIRHVVPGTFGSRAAADAPRFEHGRNVHAHTPPASTRELMDEIKIMIGRKADPVLLEVLRKDPPGHLLEWRKRKPTTAPDGRPSNDPRASGDTPGVTDEEFDNRLRRLARRTSTFNEVEKAALVRSAQILLNTRGLSEKEYAAEVYRLVACSTDTQYERVRQDVRSQVLSFALKVAVSAAGKVALTTGAGTLGVTFCGSSLGKVVGDGLADVVSKATSVRWHRKELLKGRGRERQFHLHDDPARKEFEEWANGGESKKILHRGDIPASTLGRHFQARRAMLRAYAAYDNERGAEGSEQKRQALRDVAIAEYRWFTTADQIRRVKGQKVKQSNAFAPGLDRAEGGIGMAALDLSDRMARIAGHGDYRGNVSKNSAAQVYDTAWRGEYDGHSTERNNLLGDKLRSVTKEDYRAAYDHHGIPISYMFKHCRNFNVFHTHDDPLPLELYAMNANHHDQDYAFVPEQVKERNKVAFFSPGSARAAPGSIDHWQREVDRLTTDTVMEIFAASFARGLVAKRTAAALGSNALAVVGAGVRLAQSAEAFFGAHDVPVEGHHMKLGEYVRRHARDAMRQGLGVTADSLPLVARAVDSVGDWYGQSVLWCTEMRLGAEHFRELFRTTAEVDGKVIDVSNPLAAAAGRVRNGMRSFDFGGGGGHLSGVKAAFDHVVSYGSYAAAALVETWSWTWRPVGRTLSERHERVRARKTVSYEPPGERPADYPYFWPGPILP